ncbi:transcription factor HHO6-like [Impatiens glandulifera]|uniref:transcription factor HHO6-like n=1 Tax=Impatiens glandulifera TaxID=253017 RepID=UPI001FB1777F|nr:transcription factor HHO6-like [Impatiens glandulifera]
MGSNLKLNSTIPKTINQFLDHLSLIGDVSERLSKLDDFRNKLEEERTKIDPFKRDLPLSLLLINDAIKTLKDEEEMHYRRRRRRTTTTNHQPVLEEFMPLKKTSKEDDDDDETIQLIIKDNSKDKKNWLSSAQLWKTDDDDDDDDDDSKNLDLVRSRRRNPSSQLVIEGVVKEELNNVGSFKACSMVVSMGGKTGGKEEKVDESTIPALSLVIPGMKNFKEDESSFKINGGGNKAGSSSTSSLQLQPNSRKQRRCWSPELHRQFVNALQQLGGSHVATPKQIRELMQVDGLTNDEVKSHLQKYRLHTRKASLTDENRSMILFMDQDQYSESSKQSSSQSASPHGPFDLPVAVNGGGTSLEDEEVEDDEDDKSESCGWKNQAYKSGEVNL